MDNTQAETIARALASGFDGQTSRVEIDGRLWCASVEPDPDMSIMDEQGEGMWCGRLEWTTPRQYQDWAPRPDGFDGGAEIIERDHNTCLWWQPPADVVKDEELRARVRRDIREIMEYGYSYVSVAVSSRCDRGEWHIDRSTTLGGVTPSHDWEDVADIIGELALELASED